MHTHTTISFHLLTKHAYRQKHSELACLECQGSWVQSKSYQNRFEIGVWWVSNKLTALREKSYNKIINYSL